MIYCIPKANGPALVRQVYGHWRNHRWPCRTKSFWLLPTLCYTSWLYWGVENFQFSACCIIFTVGHWDWWFFTCCSHSKCFWSFDSGGSVCSQDSIGSLNFFRWYFSLIRVYVGKKDSMRNDELLCGICFFQRQEKPKGSSSVRYQARKYLQMAV